MPASSRPPRFLLCLFPILSVLASAQDIQVPDTTALITLRLNVTITGYLHSCSRILAEEGDNVLVTVNNAGTDNVSFLLLVVHKVDSSNRPEVRPMYPDLRLRQTNQPDNVTPPESLDTVLAKHKRNYHFLARQGSYDCTEINGRKGKTVAIIHNEQPQDPVIKKLLDLTEDNYHQDSLAPIAMVSQDCHRAIDIPKFYSCEHPINLMKCRAIDWTSEELRRACLARIVNTVYCGDNNVTALQHSLKNTGFSLYEVLKDAGDMYAAIYQYSGNGREGDPDIIVAFRGTQLCFKRTIFNDAWLNCIIGFNAVEYAKRFKQASKKVFDLAESYRRVWLTGHSQGASLALHVGREAMLKKEINLTTFAFNPPLAIVCWFPHSAKKFIGRMTRPSPKQSVILSKWTPVLYVHEQDFWFCRCFIGCLKQPTQVDKWVTKLPSATLCHHSTSTDKGGVVKRLLEAHSLDQWFKPNSELKLNCQDVQSTDAGDKLNCQNVKSNEEDYGDDIEAQKYQNPEAPIEDQHTPPTGPITSTGIARVLAFFVAPVLAITVTRQRRPIMNYFRPRRRRYNNRLPRNNHRPFHWFRDHLSRAFTRLGRRRHM